MLEPHHGHRRSFRLHDYDYASPGAYFITIYTHNRECSLGIVRNETIILSPTGQIADEEWIRTAELRPGVELDSFVIMPNHLHGIVVFHDDDDRFEGAPNWPHIYAPLRRGPRSLGSLIVGFKSAATKRINALRKTLGRPVWQWNYYEHVIRTERDLDRIREYIVGNPTLWEEDEYYQPQKGFHHS